MMLQALREFSMREQEGGATMTLPPMYQETPIKWVINLDMEGRFQPPMALLVGDEKKKVDRGKRIPAPSAMRSAGVRAKLLADNGEYVLGLAREDSKPARVQKCHDAFISTVRQCAEQTKEPTVHAVLRFLENLRIEDLKLPDDFDPSMNITFRIGDEFPVDLPKVQAYWAEAALEGRGGEVMDCLVCGQRKPTVKRHEYKIKGLPGGQAAGTSLISANSDAFESYGLKESLIAPTCQECSEAFSNGLNALIQGEKSHLRIDPLVFVFWTKEEVGFSPVSLLSDSDPGEIKALLEAARKGAAQSLQLDPTPFYAAALAGNAGRAAVREWIETTVGEVQRHLARYFQLQRIVERSDHDRPYLKLNALTSSTVRDIRKDKPAPNVPRTLLRFALQGGVLPDWLLYQAVKRNRAEQGVTRPRAALIKMCLLSRQNSPEEETAMVELDQTNREPAYLCGRLLAVFEQIQRAALGQVGSTIVDRYYGTASSAPATVFGTLHRNAQHHLGRLRKEKPGAYVLLERSLEEVQAGLDRFPKTLRLEQQGLFALGYYHQRAKGWGGGAESSSDAEPES